MRAKIGFVVVMALLLGAFAASAADEAKVAPEDVEAPVQWGTADRVTHLRHLWFGGQPDRAGLRAAKDAGVEIVIDLRDPAEAEFDEKAAAEEIGLTYYNVPVAPGQPFSEEAFGQIEEIVGRGGNREVFVHCSSGNRAAAWLAAHLVDRHGLAKEQALAVAEKAGLTKPPARAATEAYLDRR